MRSYFRSFFVVLSALLLLGLLLGIAFLGARAGAVSDYPDWLQGPPEASVSSAAVSGQAAAATMRSCTTQSVEVHGYGRPALCVTSMRGWRYASYTFFFQDWGTTTSRHLFVISIGSDTEFYVVDGVTTDYPPLDAPGTDSIVFHQPHGQSWYYPRFLDAIEHSGDHYALKAAAAKTVVYADGSLVTASTAALAPGARWLVSATDNGVARTDLATGETRLVSPVRAVSGYGASSQMELAVSDDGQTVAIGGEMRANPVFRIVSVRDGCGTTAPGMLTDTNACPGIDAEPPSHDGAFPEGWPVYLRLSGHGRRLDFFIDRTDGTYRSASLVPAGAKQTRLRYLALGDSFSSGEGDPGNDPATGASYYLPKTNVPAAPGIPKEQCHLSSRSYPFLIGSFAGLSASGALPGRQMASVACNNAHISDILSDDPNGYLGQDGRLAGLSTAALDELRGEAIRGFIPGRLRQGDFVDTYQPAVLSLGVGGNDVQFAGVIRACATSVLTCSYAADATDRRNLGESIKGLYPRLTDLFGRLTRLDPGVNLYAVGYPRFVNETALACPANVNLDYAERQLVDRGVRYINQVIKAAAATAGVGYLDIQDALVGHRLCDGGTPYVNAIDFMNLYAQEGFHPDAKAHAAIAAAIEEQVGGDLGGTGPCSSPVPCPVPTAPPTLPAFFGDASVRPVFIALPAELLWLSHSPIPYLIVKGVEFTIQTSQFAYGSSARIELHSAALDLGSVSAETLTAGKALTLPADVPPGFHTLHLYGASPSGEAVDVYQIVYVADSVPMELTSGAASESGGNAGVETGSVLGAVTSEQGGSPSKQPSSGQPSPLTVVGSTIALLPATSARLWPLSLAFAFGLAVLIVRAGLALLRRPR